MAAEALTQLHGLCDVQKCDSNEPRRGGAYAHKRTYDGEIEAPTSVPSHRHVKNGVTTGKITRCVGNPKKVLQNGKDRRRQKSNANNHVKKRGKSKKIQGRKGKKG